MNMHSSLLLVAAVAASGLSAQSETSGLAERARGAARAHTEVFRTPIHEERLDGRPAELWATGPTYKASFAAGIRFVPVVGPDYPHNLPVEWQTLGVTAGGVELLLPGERPLAAPSDWRMEYRYRHVTEAYDVREDGVEQTFVIPRRPASHGDLTVRGRVETPLFAADRGPVHAPVSFVDADGVEIVRYGAAFAVDANGDTVEMTTRVDGGEISLTAPAAWLETAAYPVTVDPLLSSVLLDASDPDIVAAASVVHEPEADEYIVVLTRIVSASDHDIYGINYLSNWGAPVTVFESSIEFSTERNPQVAYVAGANEWVTVFERETFGGSGPQYRIAYHTHPTFSLTLDTTIVDFPQSTGTSRRNPDVGGTRPFSGGTKAVVVCEEESNSTNVNTTVTKIRKLVLDLATGAIAGSATIGNSSVDLERPVVNQQSIGGSTTPWVCAYQEFVNTTSGDDWDIRAAKIFPTGLWSPSNVIMGSASNSKHSVSPKVAGTADRYMITYAVLNNVGTHATALAGTEIRASRIDWPAASAIQLLHEFQCRSSSSPLVNVDLAFDTNTNGHWAALSHTEAALFLSRFMTVQRLVEDGPVETVNEGGGPANITTGFSVCYDSIDKRFPIFFTDQNGSNTRGTWLLNPSPVVPTIYGTRCGAATIGYFGEALSGSNNFGVSLNPPGTTSGSIAALLVSNGSALLPLDFIGATGCFANIDLGGGYIGSVSAVMTPFGAVIPVPIPGSYTGDVYFQYAYFAPGLNSVDLGMTKGMKVTVVP